MEIDSLTEVVRHEFPVTETSAKYCNRHCFTSHPSLPPQGGKGKQAKSMSYSLPIDGGGLGWGWTAATFAILQKSLTGEVLT